MTEIVLIEPCPDCNWDNDWKYVDKKCSTCNGNGVVPLQPK